MASLGRLSLAKNTSTKKLGVNDCADGPSELRSPLRKGMDQCSDLIDGGDGLWIAGVELGRAVVFEEDGAEFRRDMLEEGLFHLYGNRPAARPPVARLPAVRRARRRACGRRRRRPC